MASLWKHPASKFWSCCFTLPDGRQTKRSTKQTSKSVALKICVEWEEAAQKARGGNLTEIQARKVVSDIYEKTAGEALNFVSVETWMRDWVETKTVTKAKGTATRYGHTVEGFLKFLGKRSTASLALITAKDVSKFRDEQVAEGKSASTANMVVKTLRVPFNLARRQGIILSNPAEAVELLPAEAESRDAFTAAQLKAILTEAGKDTEWKGLILTSLYGGLRIGDAASLTWENLDFERRTLHFFPKKAMRGRKRKKLEVPLHPELEAYFLALKLPKADHPKVSLFPRFARSRISGAAGLSLEFRALMRRAGIIAEGEGEKLKKGKGRRVFNLSFHSLRHTFVSLLANKQISQELRMKLSGHSSSVHEAYTHHELKTLRAAIEAMPSIKELQ